MEHYLLNQDIKQPILIIHLLKTDPKYVVEKWNLCSEL
jgi:hypothetical protein